VWICLYRVKINYVRRKLKRKEITKIENEKNEETINHIRLILHSNYISLNLLPINANFLGSKKMEHL